MSAPRSASDVQVRFGTGYSAQSVLGLNYSSPGAPDTIPGEIIKEEIEDGLSYAPNGQTNVNTTETANPTDGPVLINLKEAWLQFLKNVTLSVDNNPSFPGNAQLTSALVASAVPPYQPLPLRDLYTTMVPQNLSYSAHPENPLLSPNKDRSRHSSSAPSEGQLPTSPLCYAAHPENPLLSPNKDCSRHSSSAPPEPTNTVALPAVSTIELIGPEHTSFSCEWNGAYSQPIPGRNRRTIHSHLATFHLPPSLAAQYPSSEQRAVRVSCIWTGCGEMVRLGSLAGHIATHHLHSDAYKCKLCGRALSRKDAAVRHEKTRQRTGTCPVNVGRRLYKNGKKVSVEDTFAS